MALYFQSSQKSLLIYPTLKLGGQGLYFTDMIIWLQCLFPLWKLQMLCYEWMLWLTLLNRHFKILKRLFQLLMLNKHKLKRCFTKQIGFRYSDSCSKKNVCYYSYPMLHIIPDLNTNVTHFTKHMNKMIGSINTPKASIASLWETLTSFPW